MLKGQCEDLELLKKVFEHKGHEIIWKARTPDVFAAMDRWYEYAVKAHGLEDDAEDLCFEAADRFNSGPRVGKRPQWHRVNKASKDSNRFYVRFDDKMVMDAALADALDLDLTYVRTIALRDYKQAETTRRPAFKARKKKRLKLEAWKEKQRVAHEATQQRNAEIREQAKTVAEAVVSRFCGKTMQPGEVRSVRSYSRKSAESILKVGQVDPALIPDIIVNSLRKEK